MSWSASFDLDGGEIIEETVRESNVTVEHHVDQYEAAPRAVWNLQRERVLGDETRKYRVSFSGHGNPNHEPTSGWGNDFITISISQL